jgi:hypothetical protein
MGSFARLDRSKNLDLQQQKNRFKVFLERE